MNKGVWHPARDKYFLPVKALSKLFRAHFQNLLRKAPLYASIPKQVWSKAWVVHALPVGDGQAALKYLAPYIYRVAISNRRLINFVDKGSLEKSQVTFQYRQSETGQLKLCTLSVEQFIQRFLQHVLPKGFVKVRYFGFFAHNPARFNLPEGSVRGNRRKTLAALKKLLAQETPPIAPEPQVESNSAAPTSPKVLCPACGTQMNFIRDLAPCAAPRPVARSP